LSWVIGIDGWWVYSGSEGVLMMGVLAGQNRGSGGPRTRGFVWASKREGENRHTETRSNFGIFCLARVRGVVREGLVYNRGLVAGV